MLKHETIKNLTSLSIKEFLDSLDSAKPIPGAGSSIAVAGGLGVSLLGMAIRISVKKEPGHPQASIFIQKIEQTKNKLLELAYEDCRAVSLVFLDGKTNKAGYAQLMEPILGIIKTLTPTLKDYLKTYYHQCYLPVKSDAEAGILLIKTCIKACIQVYETNLEDLTEPQKTFYRTKLETFLQSVTCLGQDDDVFG